MTSFKHQLCGVVIGPTLHDCYRQIDVFRHQADCIEIRIDSLHSPSLEMVKNIMDYSPLPSILTIRSKSQGGHFTGTQEEHIQWIQKLSTLSPPFIDIETHLSPKVTEKLQKECPEIKVICSYHDLQHTPKNLSSLFNEMQRHDAAIYKFITYAHHSLDGMKMLHFVKHCKSPMIGFCMGEEGTFTRAVAPVLGSLISYVSENQPVAPGQFSMEEMVERFRIKEASTNTDLLGLIGDPVHRSPSKKTHHLLIKEMGKNAIYVDIRVLHEHLSQFLSLAKEIGFKGLSVTMPHKETIAKLIHASEQAVNTLHLTEKGYIGWNTDGVGAMDVIEKEYGPVLTSHIVILGAGGAAYGIAKEALQRGAKVTILNRTAYRAENLGNKLGCFWDVLEHFGTVATKGYDILINTIPSYDQCPAPPEMLLPGKVCLEVISNPRETAFYVAALEKKCIVIPGMEMFLTQAKKQFAGWYGRNP